MNNSSFSPEVSTHKYMPNMFLPIASSDKNDVPVMRGTLLAHSGTDTHRLLHIDNHLGDGRQAWVGSD